jgi:hypothetical protein
MKADDELIHLKLIEKGIRRKIRQLEKLLYGTRTVQTTQHSPVRVRFNPRVVK